MTFRSVLNDHRIRFLFVGATNTGVGYGLFLLFDRFVFGDLPFGYLLSVILSYAIAISLAFVLYRRLVFVVVGHWVRDFARFVSVYLVSIGVNLIGLPVLVEWGGLAPWLGQLIMLVVTTVFSYVGHRWFSFRRPPSPSAASEETEP